LSYTKIQWGAAFVILFINIFWISFSPLKIYYDKEAFLGVFIILSILFFFYMFYKVSQRAPRMALFLESLLFILIFILLLLVLCFLMATLKYPFVDSTLVFIDSIFQINSSAVVLWFRTHELLNYIFYLIYKIYFYQIPFIIVYFSIRGDVLVLQRFVMQFIIALILTIIISGFLPALGPYVWYNYQPSPTLAAALAQLLELREGILDFSQKNGIVSLPSFHTVAALLYMYTFRNENKVLFVSIMVLNTLMIFSCIPIGEHYFADILGAIPTFLVVIWMDSLIYKYVVHPQL
jgi:hypothetical protein